MTEARCLRPVYQNYEHFYILNHKIFLPADMQARTYFISHSERDWKFVINLWEAFMIFKKERPDLILSTGAGLVVPVALIGRLFFNTKLVFIESITRANSPSLTGRLVYPLVDTFFYQWKHLEKYFPNGKYLGPIV